MVKTGFNKQATEDFSDVTGNASGTLMGRELNELGTLAKFISDAVKNGGHSIDLISAAAETKVAETKTIAPGGGASKLKGVEYDQDYSPKAFYAEPGSPS